MILKLDFTHACDHTDGEYYRTIYHDTIYYSLANVIHQDFQQEIVEVIILAREIIDYLVEHFKKYDHIADRRYDSGTICCLSVALVVAELLEKYSGRTWRYSAFPRQTLRRILTYDTAHHDARNRNSICRKYLTPGLCHLYKRPTLRTFNIEQYGMTYNSPGKPLLIPLETL